MNNSHITRTRLASARMVALLIGIAIVAMPFSSLIPVPVAHAAAPEVTIVFPQPGSVSFWNPSIDWGEAVSCEYSVNDAPFQSLPDCDESFIPPPAGWSTLSVRGLDAEENATTVSVENDYSTNFYTQQYAGMTRTGDATDITQTTATLSAIVEPAYAEYPMVTVGMSYEPLEGFSAGWSTFGIYLEETGSWNANTEVTFDITDLSCGTTYIYRTNGTNENESSEPARGGLRTFETLPCEGVEFAGGDGSGGDPYQINSCEMLQGMKDDLSATYALIDDVDCSETSVWNSDGDGGYYGFEPVGASSTPFTGTFDGDEYVISDLYIHRQGAEGVGLFGFTDNAYIYDLEIQNAHIYGQHYVGGIVGGMANGVIEDVKVNTDSIDVPCATDDGTGACVWARLGTYGGGIVGHLSENGNIMDSSSGGPVKGSGIYIGGLVGYLEAGELTYSSTTATVDGGFAIGGAVGYMNGGLVGAVSAEGDVYINQDEDFKEGVAGGGLVGYMNGGGIYESRAIGNVTSTNSNTGGLVGQMQGGVIEDAYATGSVTGVSQTGGLIGLIGRGSIERAYATGNVEGVENVGGFIGALAEFAGEIRINDSFAAGRVEEGANAAGFVGFNDQGQQEGDVEELFGVYFDMTRTQSSLCFVDHNSTEVGSYAECLGVNEDGESSDLFYSAENPPLDEWNFEEVWREVSDDFPVLQILNGGSSDEEFSVESLEADYVNRHSAHIEAYIATIPDDRAYDLFGARYVEEGGDIEDGTSVDVWPYGLELSTDDDSYLRVALRELDCDTDYVAQMYIGTEEGGALHYADDLVSFTTDECVDMVDGPEETILDENTFEEGGVAQNWRSDDEYWSYDLPFDFTFYGVEYDTVYVSSNGFIGFEEDEDLSDYGFAIDRMVGSPTIIAFGVDMTTEIDDDDDIYITNTGDSVTFRWRATEYRSSLMDLDYKLNFAITLYEDSSFELSYGDQEMPTLYPLTVGVQDGNASYVMSDYYLYTDLSDAFTSRWEGTGEVDPNPAPARQRSYSNKVAPKATVAPNEALLASLRAQLNALMLQLSALMGAPATLSDVRDLEMGMQGADVSALQSILIAAGGSIPPGATGYFGAYTRDALASYQGKNGILPAVGYFGSVTRAQMKAAGVAGLWW